MSWAGFKQITFRKMKLYSHFFLWKQGKGERELIFLFSHNRALVETWDDEQAEQLQRTEGIVFLCNLNCKQSKSTQKQHNLCKHDAQTRMSDEVLVMAPPAVEAVTQKETHREGTWWFPPSLALLRTQNNFQAIKEVIKHTQHREGVSLMRILTAGGSPFTRASHLLPHSSTPASP